MLIIFDSFVVCVVTEDKSVKVMVQNSKEGEKSKVVTINK